MEYEAKQIKIPEVHFLNDKLQEGAEDYGYYEENNKINYFKFEWWFNKKFGDQYDGEPKQFKRDIIPEMKRLALDALKVSRKYLDPDKRNCNF